MIHQKIMEQINQQITELLKNNPFQDVEKNIRAILIAIFSKLDLVTREEFDIQQKVLLSTRKKIDELECIIKKLELSELSNKNNEHHCI
jgi:ubiquinone biosynthesis accessory factor UbiK